MALVAKRHAEDLGGPMSGGKRMRFEPPLREVQNGSLFHGRPAGWDEHLQALQQQFPALHVGIVSSILESSGNRLAEAAVALRKIAACAPSSPAPSDEDALTPARCLKRSFDAVSEGEASSPAPFPALGAPRCFTEQEIAERQQVVHAADRLVAQLQGMPSVDAAKLAARTALLAFAQDVATHVRQQPPATPQPAAGEDRAQSLSAANKVLFKAMQVLNDRNRVLQAQAGEAEKLRAELETCQAEGRRLSEANKVLQWHLEQSNRAQIGGIGFGGDGIF